MKRGVLMATLDSYAKDMAQRRLSALRPALITPEANNKINT